MKIGFGAPVSGSWATPGIIREVCGRADELGYASLWTFQRLLVPRDSKLKATYESVLDPMIALGYLAACTQRARLGVAIVNAPFVSPILLAKQAAAIDVLSEGRLALGLGIGWAAEEFAASGATMEKRGVRVEEYVRCLADIFTGAPDFKGDFYEVPASSVLPTPIRKPPVLMGGAAPAALARVGRIADGWISSSGTDLTGIGDLIQIVRSSAAEAGRDPGSIEVVVRGLVQLTGEQGSDRKPLVGSAEQIRADLAGLSDQGVDEVFIDLNFDEAVGSPRADAAASLSYALEVLETFAS